MTPYEVLFHLGNRFSSLTPFKIERRRPVRDAIDHLSTKMREFGVETLIDVGANSGQFGRAIRKEGYTGAIYSVEPLSSAYARLAAATANDSNWHLLPRMALGAEVGEAEINISHNLASSSLLNVNERSVAAAPESAFSSRETIEVRTLDAVADPGWKRPMALKIDTQGYEGPVLIGAAKTLADVRLVLLEMSLAPLYDGSLGFADLYKMMEDNGFRCIGLTQGFANHETHELLQVDGLFVREPATL